MSAAAWVVLATVLAVPMGVWTIYLTLRSQAREQAAARAQEKQETYNKGFADGKASMQAQADLLTFQRDDAQHDRDAAQHRADAFESRYNDLRDKGIS